MMLGSRMYYPFVDDTSAILQHSIAQLRKELEGIVKTLPASNVDPRAANSGSAVSRQVISVAPAASSSQTLVDLSTDEICKFCVEHSIPEAADALRQQAIDGRALSQLLRCVDLQSLDFAVTLQSRLGLPTLGASLRLIYEAHSAFPPASGRYK